MVDHDEEQLSDKNKISLFDDSKFEDLTIENNLNREKGACTLEKDSLYDPQPRSD